MKTLPTSVHRHLLISLLGATFSVAGTPTDLARSVPGTVASQTTSHGSGLYPAEHCLDDDFTTFNHTDSSGIGAAWELTFPSEQEIGQVELITRDCCGGRLNGATLRLFDNTDTIIYEIPIVDSGPLTSFATPQLTGLFAKRLRIGFEPAQSGIVHMAEIYAFSPLGPPPTINSFASNPDSITSGQSALLSWTTTDTSDAELHGHGALSPNDSTSVSPPTSTIYYLTATNDCGTTTATTSVIVDGVPLLPRITEFEAYPDDWIEVFNPSNSPLDLTGWHLTDDLLNPTRWTFPPGSTIQPGAFLVIDEPFKLAREAGSYLALTDPSGTTISSFTYPWQTELGTYGIDFDDVETFFLEPSPGTFNGGSTTNGFLPGATFSTNRGFFTSAFSLSLTPMTTGASVLYSLDGSDPTTPYTSPIPISTTTVVRAIEVLGGYEDSRSTAHTYLFADHVETQPEFPAGWPVDWQQPGASGALAPIPRPSDYQMDPDIVSGAPFTDANNLPYDTTDALLDIPTISLTLPVGELLDPIEGLHSNARLRGRDWEREISMEILDPVASDHFHTGCGLRIHGGRGRVEEMLKKSFRLYFRGDYGATKLTHPLFDGLPKGGADHLVLRGGNGKTWASPWRGLELGSGDGGNSLPRTTYLRDQLVRDSAAAMDQPSFAGNFVHLYINGMYWGLYNPVERPGGPYAANHFGGDNDLDWDFLKWANGIERQPIAGDGVAWDEVMNLARTGATANWSALKQRIDMVNLADFMIANIWPGNSDWAGTGNNAYGFRSRLPHGDGLFRFMLWDAEECLLDQNANTTEGGRNDDTPVDLYKYLRSAPEFKLLFADRIHRHMIDEDGVMQTAPVTARFNALAAGIDRAITAESARWGDLLRADPYDRENDWLVENNKLNLNFFPNRPNTSFSQMQADGLYPSVAAPVAALTPGNLLNITAPAGTIYYTTDGSDPRLEGGAVSPSAQSFNGGAANALLPFGSNWFYLDDGNDLSATNWMNNGSGGAPWTVGTAPLGYGDITGMTFNTVIDSGPGPNDYITAYFRRQFNIPDKNTLGQVYLQYLYDDGLALYINGSEFIRDNLPGGTLTGNSNALGSATEGITHSTVIPHGLLIDGLNTIAVEVHQRSNSSNGDTGFDLAITDDSVGGIPLNGDILVNTRALSGGTWSALESEAFLFGNPLTDLVISEIMYHPTDPTPAEITAGYNDDDHFEFIEIRNISDIDIVLDGLRLSKGVDVDLVGTLPPGESGIVVANLAAFQMRYGTGQQIIAQWEAGDKLDNGGEQIRMRDGNNNVVREFTYDDVPDWPTSPDGSGYSLVLLDPFSQPDHTDPFSWRPSASIDGNPGTTDSTTFPGGDDTALLDYATNNIPPKAVTLPDGTLSITVHLNQFAEDLAGSLEMSTDLLNWTPADILSRTNLTETSGGFANATFTASPPLSDPVLFIRYSVSLR